VLFRSGLDGAVAATQPYVDAQTGEVCISYARELFDENGNSIGILALDVLLNRLTEYIKNLRLADKGYGILLNQSFEVIAHPNKRFEGRMFEETGEGGAKISAMLRSGRPVSSVRVENFIGEGVTVFFKPISNGWYVGIVTPVNDYYYDTYVMAGILALIGLSLMITLMILLMRLHRRIESNTEVVMELNRASIQFVPVQFMDFLGVNNITRMRLGNCVKRAMTVMFFDIRYFSVHSEMMSLDDNFAFINEVFGAAGPIIRAHNGIIDKYLGDAAMVLFEKPEDAIRAGVKIYQTLILDENSRVKIGADGINIGIGIHTGSVMLGIIGDNERLSSTVISKHVNVASRLEGLTKQVKAAMLASSEAVQSVPDAEKTFETRYIGLIQPAGNNEVTGVFEILDALPPRLRDRRLKTRRLFESAIRKYHTKDYKAALLCFERIVSVDKTDVCAARYLEETRKRVQDPSLPSVFVFDLK
jgi:class 3 adenylate cyclase